MFARFRIEDNSMEPTLKPGDYLIVNKLAYMFSKPSKGDIIVFRHPKDSAKFLVKRVDSKIGHMYFIKGDNVGKSHDSRHFGPIDKKLIVGKMLLHIKKR